MTRNQQMTPLGHVVELVMGQAPPSKDCNFEGKGTPFVKVGEFGAGRPVIREWTTNPLRMARKTDVLLCVVGATCGKINLGEDCAIGRSVAAIRPKDSVLDQYYLYYFMMTLVERLRSGSIGAAQTVISKDMISSVEIPVPPLPEQHRIVAILDEAFDGIATTKANAERNLQNARALFESHLQSVFTERGEGWEENQLGDIAEVQSGGTPSIFRKEFWYGSIPWYSSGELNQTFTSVSERKITESGLNNSNAKLFPKGSLLVGMYDTAALKMSILDRDGAFNQAIAGIKPNEKIEVEFILHAINANKPKLLLERRGTRQKNLSLGKIKEIAIPLPPIAEQRSTIVQLRRVMSETQRLESLYQQKLTALDDLKKSLLHQAFSGQLQGVDLLSCAGNR